MQIFQNTIWGWIDRNLLDQTEVDLVRKTVEDGILAEKYLRDDGTGKKVTMALWNHPGSDGTGIVARSDKLAGIMEKAN